MTAASSVTLLILSKFCNLPIYLSTYLPIYLS